MSYGEQLMKAYLDEMLGRLGLEYIDNYRPEWLTNEHTGHAYELDRYYPVLKAGFEFQGEQHYKDPLQIHRDRHKWQLCRARGVIVVQVDASDLEYTRMRSIVKQATRSFRLTLPRSQRWRYKKSLGKPEVLRVINAKATKYRAILRSKYPGAGSVHRRSSKVRHTKIGWDSKQCQGDRHDYRPLDNHQREEKRAMTDNKVRWHDWSREIIRAKRELREAHGRMRLL